MKIKLSKTQWEQLGKKAGWMKESQAPKEDDANVSRRRHVKVFFSDGDYLETPINGTVPEILEYYMPWKDKDGKPRGPDQDYSNANPNALRHVVNVEFLD